LRAFARTIVVITAFALFGLALTPVGSMVSSGLVKTQSPSTRDFRVRGPADDHSDQAELFLLLIIVRDVVKQKQESRPTPRGESDEKRTLRNIVAVNFDQ
jgi:hypothetical protein